MVKCPEGIDKMAQEAALKAVTTSPMKSQIKVAPKEEGGAPAAV